MKKWLVILLLVCSFVMPNSVNAQTNLTIKYNAIKQFFKDTDLKGLELKICEVALQEKVDPYFIASVAYHESGKGTSPIAKEKNNLFGLNAIDGAAYEKAFRFAKKEDSIIYFGSMIRDMYSGLTIDEIGKKYASDPEWAKLVKGYMADLKALEKNA